MALILILVFATAAQAHETRPAIADLDIGQTRAQLSITLPLEAPLAEIDLDGITDTNDAPQAAQYDQLRALSAPDLAALVRKDWPRLSGKITLESGGVRLPLSLTGVDVPADIARDLPRDSLLSISAALPPGDAAVTFAWDADLGPIVLRQIGAGPEGYTAYLTSGAASDPIPRGAQAAPTSATSSFLRYLVLGFEHIIPKGTDHILFVLGLFFFSTKLRPLLVQITAFTAAHTVTLALAIFGVVSVPSGIVEPLIALSIAYIAFENITLKQITPWRTFVVFAFGLLHGLGFASVLGDIGLSSGHALRSLLAFNIGVEIGQLSVILLAYGLIGAWFGQKPWYRTRIAIPASVMIGLVGVYWFVERIVGQIA
ncbi:hypothetical protein BV911_13195 [Pseudoruegeria sp. SK021]|nr:hypothetical protein BV911_13195 [Pseudoruegeria sp. SK021]